MPTFKWVIEEVDTADASIDSIIDGDVDLQDLEVSRIPKSGIDETDNNVALDSVPGGEVEKPEELEKKVIAPKEKGSFDNGKKFNQIVIAILVGLLALGIIPAIFVFVLVAVSDIWQGKLDLEKYISLVIAFIYGLGTFLAGLGVGSFVKKSPENDSG